MTAEQKIRGLFSNTRIIKVMESKLMSYGTEDEVKSILEQLTKENKIKREVYGFCDDMDCGQTFKLSDYENGEDIECEYGHEFLLDKDNIGKIVYWTKVKKGEI